MNFSYYPYPNNTYQFSQMQTQQQQNSSFIHVPSEEVARNYAVTPGGSVTFIDDNAPYCYTKTAGFSQFDAPVFRKFRLVEETDSGKQKPAESSQESTPSFVTVESFSNEITALRTKIEELENRISMAQKPAQNQQSERRNKNESFTKQQQ